MPLCLTALLSITQMSLESGGKKPQIKPHRTSQMQVISGQFTSSLEKLKLKTVSLSFAKNHCPIP